MGVAVEASRARCDASSLTAAGLSWKWARARASLSVSRASEHSRMDSLAMPLYKEILHLREFDWALLLVSIQQGLYIQNVV